MSDEEIENSRRKFITGAFASAAALPLLGLSRHGWAKSGKQKVDPGSSLAQSLHYTHDAAKLPASVARKSNQFCHNCQFFQASGGSPEWAPCLIFSGQLVSRDGWCSSWAPQG